MEFGHRANVLHRIHQIRQGEAGLELAEFVAGFPLVLLANEWVEYRLLTFDSGGHLFAFNFFANGGELILNIKVVDEIGEVLDIVLVVHLGVLLEHYILVNGRVALLAALLFEFFYEFLCRLYFFGQFF